MSIELNGNKFTTWDDARKEMFTPEEIAESDLRVALIGELINLNGDPETYLKTVTEYKQLD